MSPLQSAPMQTLPLLTDACELFSKYFPHGIAFVLQRENWSLITADPFCGCKLFCACYFACDLVLLCLHRQWKDGQRGTDGALCRMIPQQTLFEWLFNVKCDKCLGGSAIEAEKSKSLFLLLVLCILIKSASGATHSHRHSGMYILTWTHTGATCMWKMKESRVPWWG